MMRLFNCFIVLIFLIYLSSTAHAKRIYNDTLTLGKSGKQDVSVEFGEWGVVKYSTSASAMLISVDGSTFKELVTTDGTAEFENKEIADALLFQEVTTQATPTTGIKLYAKNDNKLYQLTDDGTESEIGGGAGFTSPLTNDGDIMIFDTVDARLPIGTASQVLTVSSLSGLPMWADIPEDEGGGGATLTIQQVQYEGHAGFGSADLAIPYFTNKVFDTATATLVTISNDSTNGLRIYANTDALLYVTYNCDSTSALGGGVGVSKNATGDDLDYPIYNLTNNNLVLCGSADGTGNDSMLLSCTAHTKVITGDYVRPHCYKTASFAGWVNTCVLNILAIDL